MGLTPGLMVRALFLFALKNPLVMLETLLVVLINLLVVSVAWGLFSPPIGIESIGDVVLLVVLVPKGFKSKGGRLIEIFWRPNTDFPSKFQNQFCSYNFVMTLPRSFQPL